MVGGQSKKRGCGTAGVQTDLRKKFGIRGVQGRDSSGTNCQKNPITDVGKKGEETETTSPQINRDTEGSVHVKGKS